MAKPGMRLVVLEEPPIDVPQLSIPYVSSLVDGGASLLESLRNTQVSPVFSHPRLEPSVLEVGIASTNNASHPTMASGEHLFQSYLFVYAPASKWHRVCTLEILIRVVHEYV